MSSRKVELCVERLENELLEELNLDAGGCSSIKLPSSERPSGETGEGDSRAGDTEAGFSDSTGAEAEEGSGFFALK